MSSINVDYIGEAGLNTAMTLLKAEIDAKADPPGIGKVASPSADGYMPHSDKAKLDAMTSVLNSEILFDSESGTTVTNASPSIQFGSGKSLSAYTDGYIEIFFKQNGGTNGGVNSAKALIHSVSGAVTVEPVQLIAWTYDATSTSLSFTSCTATLSNGSTITLSNPENSAFSFTIYRIVGYK